MAYKIVNKTQLDYDLKRLANTIRNKEGSSNNLTFPDGMAATIRGWSIQNSYYDGWYSPVRSSDSANYVLVDGTDLDSKITTVCNAFRSIYGDSSLKIQFPDELIRRIECLDVAQSIIDPGSYYITGTYMDYNWGGFEQSIQGYIRMSDGYDTYNGSFDKLVLSDDTMTLDIYYQGTLVKSAYQGSWSWGSTGIVVTISETQSVSGKFKAWWDKNTTIKASDITFYYENTPYTVSPGTTWFDFVYYDCPIPSLTIHMPENTYYIYDQATGSYVGDSRAVEGGEQIRATYYTSGFGLPSEPDEPDDPYAISFTVDHSSYSVTSGTTIKQWLDSDAPGMYIDNNGYLYNQSAGSYVAEYAELSNGSYEAASVSRIIYSGDAYYTDSSVQIPKETHSFYIDGHEYEFYEGETWSDVISRLGDYSNIFGHMGTYFGDDVLWDEGQANILLSDDNMNNHTFMPVRVTYTIEVGGHYSWENASYFNGSETFTFSNMSTLPTSSEHWYMFNQPVEMQIYDTDIHGTAWTSEDNYTLNLSTSSTDRNVLDSYYGYPAQLPDHGVMLLSSNTSGYKYIFYQNAQYNYTADRSELIYPVGKIKLSPGAYPQTFAMWLLANTTSE